MTTTRRFLFAVALTLLAAPLVGRAQTPGQQLERAIFTQDTVGDLDGAIGLYRQILTARLVPADVEAEARTRLADSLRRKGQPPQARAAGAQAAQSGGCCGMFSGNYDETRAVTVTGTVTALMWVNPQSVVVVQGTDGNKYGFTLAAPNQMLLGGLNRTNGPKPGEMVTIKGFLAHGGDTDCPKALPNACPTLAASVAPPPPATATNAAEVARLQEQLASLAQNRSPTEGAVHASALSIVTADGRNLFDRPALEKAAAAAAQR